MEDVSQIEMLLFLAYFTRWSKWLTAQFLVHLYLAQPRVLRTIKDFRSLTTSGVISQSSHCQVCKNINVYYSETCFLALRKWFCFAVAGFCDLYKLLFFTISCVPGKPGRLCTRKFPSFLPERFSPPNLRR